MALQTSTHSRTDEPTLTNPYPPPPTGPPPPGWNSNKSFTPAGSPPLILAFLAIGLFSAAMIVIFGWRRFRFGRSWTLNDARNQDPEALAQKELLARKPKLWDLWATDLEAHGGWTEKEKGVGVRPGWWAAISPLSAKAVSVGDDDDDAEDSIEGMVAEPPPRRPRTSLSLAFRVAGSVFQPVSGRIENLWQRTRPVRPPSEKEPPSDLSPHPPRQTTLHVEVAILMPSPDYPVYVRSDEKDEKKWRRRERNEITDYAIGLYECSWDK